MERNSPNFAKGIETVLTSQCTRLKTCPRFQSVLNLQAFLETDIPHLDGIELKGDGSESGS